MPKKPISQAPSQSESRPTVTVHLELPAPLYAWMEYAAQQKGLSVGHHIAEWVMKSLEPWEEDTPLPLDAHSIEEVHFEESAAGGPFEAPPERPPPPWRPEARRSPALNPEDFPDLAAYKKAERVQRAQKASETLRRKRALKPQLRWSTKAEKEADLPAYVKAIAWARFAHQDLTLEEFALLLHQQGIYSSQPRSGGEAHPVEKSTLAKWLRQARRCGLLA
jgi:hypothetical protein